MGLLTVSNTKTRKGEAYGYRTLIMHLAPAKLSGFNTCPGASKGCAAACLNTSGMGKFSNVQIARIRKTVEFFNNRETWLAALVKEVRAAIRKAERDGMVPVFRLNGTSDIRWENVPVEGYNNIMEMFPTVQFYDYTKLANRRNLPSNYHLTFSRSEENDYVVRELWPTSTNIAIVFDVPKDAPLPEYYNGRTIVDGDATDLRFLDPAGVVVGLRGKGDAKGDTSGFVVNVPCSTIP